MFDIDSFAPTAPLNGRYVNMPVGRDCFDDVRQGSQPPALGTFFIRQRDTLDYGIDFADWLSANNDGGAATLTAAVWAVAATSPKTPVIVGHGFDTSGKTAVTITPAAGAVAGDAYWLEVTITVSAVPASPGFPALPARTLVRKINVVVVNG